MHSFLLCLGLAFGLSLCLTLGSALGWPSPTLATDLIFSSDAAHSDPQLTQMELQGAVQVFLGDYRILAEALHWDKASKTLQAQGQVECVSPQWALKAAALRLDFKQQTLSAQEGQLQYLGLELKFEQAEITPYNWQFKGVRFSAPGLPGQIEAQTLLIYPELSHENIQFSQARWSALPWLLPHLNLSLPLGDLPPERASELRSQTGWFSPSFNLVEGGLALGSTLRLHQDASQRLYARLDYHPVQGLLAGLSHEWRPENQMGVLNSEILWQNRLSTAMPNSNSALPAGPLRGHLEWQGTLWGRNFLRAGLFRNAPSAFFSRLLLPPLKNSLSPLEWHSEALFLSDWLFLPGLRLRGLLGARLTQAHWHGAGSVQAISQPWIPLPGLGFQASGLLNGLLGESGQALTGGLRLLGEWEAQPNWLWGAYGEQYLSGLPGEVFAQSSWLMPRSGVYSLWKISPDLALGGRVEWLLPAQDLSAAETMLSYRQGLWVLNLLVQGIPPGLQVQLQTALF